MPFDRPPLHEYSNESTPKEILNQAAAMRTRTTRLAFTLIELLVVIAIIAVLVRRHRGDDDALGVDHLAHHAAGAVRRGEEDLSAAGVERQHVSGGNPAGGHRLQAAEHRVRCGVGTG